MVNYVIKRTYVHLSLLWKALTREGFILFNGPDTNQKSQVGHSNQGARPRLLKAALVPVFAVFESLMASGSLSPYLWLDSITAKMPVSRFAKTTASMQADRNEGHWSRFRGWLRERTIDSSHPSRMHPNEPLSRGSRYQSTHRLPANTNEKLFSAQTQDQHGSRSLAELCQSCPSF